MKSPYTTIALAILCIIPSSGQPAPKQRTYYIISQDAKGVGSALGVGGSGARDCDAEQRQCYRDCFKNAPPWPMTKGDKGHHKYCETTCLDAYMTCIKETEKARSKLTFPKLDSAISWLSSHKEQVALGTLVVVGTTTFVVTTGGAGALILAPLL